MSPRRSTIGATSRAEGSPPMTTDVADLAPLARPNSVTLAATESARMVAMLRALEPHQWSRPTDCPAWDVRAMAGHVLGMIDTFSSLPRFARTMIAGGRAAGDGLFIDGLTAVQVRDNAALRVTELLDRMEAGGPRQARWRGSRRLMRAIPLKQPLHPGEAAETWHLGFLFDTILTRDTWMHRVDVARATGRPLELTADHDGRIVADVVAEWARRHHRSFRLHLTGDAGGRYTHAAGGDPEDLTLDAVEFCRIVSRRAPGQGLLAHEVPF